MTDDLKVPPITKLPPGRVPGAGDLHEWAQRRNAGHAGVSVSKKECEHTKQIRHGYRGYLEDAADRLLAQAERRGSRR